MKLNTPLLVAYRFMLLLYLYSGVTTTAVPRHSQEESPRVSDAFPSLPRPEVFTDESLHSAGLWDTSKRFTATCCDLMKSNFNPSVHLVSQTISCFFGELVDKLINLLIDQSRKSLHQLITQ